MHTQIDFADNGTVRILIYCDGRHVRTLIGYTNWWDAYVNAKRIQSLQRV
jgi:hypothetical protein